MQRRPQPSEAIFRFREKNADQSFPVELCAHRSLFLTMWRADFASPSSYRVDYATLNCDTDPANDSASLAISSTVTRAESVAFCVATAPPVKSLIVAPTVSVLTDCSVADLEMICASSDDR